MGTSRALRQIANVAWLCCVAGGLSCAKTTTQEPLPDGGGHTDLSGRADAGPPPDGGADVPHPPLADAGGFDCASDADLNPYTVEVLGEGFSAAEGATVHVYTAMRLVSGDAICRAHGDTVVAGGTFERAVTSYSDGAAFPRVVVWIDRDGDGECEPGVDLLHDEYWTALNRVSRTLTPEDFEGPVAPTPEACGPFGGDGGDPPMPDADACVFINPAEVPGGRRASLLAHGADFEAFEGTRVHLVALTWDLSPLAVAEVVIDGGAFEFDLPDAVTDYTGVGLYIDLDGDGSCDPDEPMHQMTTGVADLDTQLVLSPGSFAPGDCLINGGVGDLGAPFSCPP